MNFDVTPQDKVTEAEMLAALVAATKGTRLSTPEYKTSRFYSAQWKIHGNVLWYQLSASKGGAVLAVFISTKDRSGPFYFRKNGFKETPVKSNFLARAASVTAADQDDLSSQLKPLMKKWLSMEDQDAADDIAAIMVEKKALKKGDFDIEFGSAEHGVLDIFFGKGRKKCIRVKKDGSYEVI
jgi:hypothetical protein